MSHECVQRMLSRRVIRETTTGGVVGICDANLSWRQAHVGEPLGLTTPSVVTIPTSPMAIALVEDLVLFYNAR